MTDIAQLVNKLSSLAMRTHYYCEDSWYSCPLSEGGCANDDSGNECTCGADEHNEKVRDLLIQVEKVCRDAASDTNSFKNFHRRLCERFGYVHDEVDWRRDLVYLEEWIAKQMNQFVGISNNNKQSVTATPSVAFQHRREQVAKQMAGVYSVFGASDVHGIVKEGGSS